MSSSDEEPTEEETTSSDDSDHEWGTDLRSWKEVVDRHRPRDRPCSARTLGRSNPEAGNTGSLNNIMVGYAAAVEEALNGKKSKLMLTAERQSP